MRRVPSTNTTNETEFVEHAPAGVSVHAARVEGGPCTVETLERMATDVERSATLLADQQPGDAVAGPRGCGGGGTDISLGELFEY